MTVYTKEVYLENLVQAKIYADGKQIKWEMFTSAWNLTTAGNIESLFKKAHKWADAMIAACEKYEVRQ